MSGEERPWLSARAGLIVFSALMTLMLLVVYRACLHAGFIWDDGFHFAGNPNMESFRGLINIWTSRSAIYYPLVLTTFWVMRRLVGLDPFAYHLLNILMHAATTVLLYTALRRLKVRGAWVGAALFALCPLHVETVAWVTELKNTQSAVFFLLSFLCAEKAGWFDPLRVAEAPARRLWNRLALLVFLFALLSKPSTVMLPVVFAAVMWWKHGRLRWSHLDWLIPFFVFALLSAGWTVWEQRYSSGAIGFEWDYSLLERILLAGRIFWFYLAKFIWPIPVMFLYPRWELSAADPAAWLYPLGAVALVAAAWMMRKRTGRIPLVVLLLYAALLFPVLGFFNIYFTRYAFVADHFAYLPSMPVLAAFGAGIASLAGLTNRPVQRAVLTVVFAAPLLIFGMVVCRWHTHTFHSSEALWSSAIRANPDAWMAHNNLGLLYRDKGETEAAVYHFRKALAANPDHYEAMCNLGGILLAEGRLEDALGLFRQAVKLRPDYPLAWTNLGLAESKTGDAAAARRAYETALSHQPTYAEAWGRLAALEEQEGRVQASADAFRKALAARGYDEAAQAGFLFERAYKLREEGREAQAMAMLDQVLLLNPSLPDAHLMRGMMLMESAEYDDASDAFRRALALRSGWPAASYRLALILAAHPDPAKRNLAEAGSRMKALVQAGGGGVPEILDTAAIIAAGESNWAAAVRGAETASGIAREKGNDALAAEADRRAGLFRRQEVYVLPERTGGETRTDTGGTD